MGRLGILFVCAACACGAVPAGPDAGPDAAYDRCPAPATWLWAWYGCADGCPPGRPGVDDDADGLSELDGDCDDRTPWVGPAAEEVCDLRDNDCDGAVDEGDVCPPADVECPLSYADVRCCGASHTIAGAFYELPAEGVASSVSPGGGFADPWVVLVRRTATGEMRAAVTCPAPPETAYGYPFRFRLRDDAFVRPGESYQLLIHLRWYFPVVADLDSDCFHRVPMVVPDEETASVCVDYGAAILGCL